MKKLKVGIIGATGMVGQRFIQLLSSHPWFEVVIVAASPQSTGKNYEQAVKDRWQMENPIPKHIKDLTVKAVEGDKRSIAEKVNLIFSALNIENEAIKRIEENYAALGIPVISNNAAHRWTEDIPLIIPEINPEHIKLIEVQKKNRRWEKGFITVKPNCSIQSYTAILSILKQFEPQKVKVVSLQSISGAGKTLETWPEMVDNVIPFIKGEEEKSEKEPMKIWGKIKNKKIQLATKPKISATCIRAPISNGHLACVSVSFKNNPSKEQIIEALINFKNPIAPLQLPSAPKNFIQYLDKDDRPQTKKDRDFEKGMGISIGQLQKDKYFDWKFTTLSHNTIRGAAGGAILMAELLVKKGYI